MKKAVLLLVLALTVAGHAFCDEADDWLARGIEKCQKGDIEGGISDFNKAIELKANFAEAYYNRGNAKASKGDLDGAMTDLSKAIELKPDLAFAYGARSMVRRSRQDLDGALADLDKLIELDPKISRAYYDRGDVKYAKGEWAGAISDYNKAIELNPNVFGSYCSRGNAKRYSGDLDGALADFNKAIGLNQREALPYHDRGLLRYDQQSFAIALADFRKAIDLGSSRDYLRFYNYLAQSRIGEESVAAKELQTYLENRKTGKPDDWQATIAHFLIGQLSEAEFLRAAAVSAENVRKGQLCEAYFYAGTRKLIQGDKKTAKDYFEKCLATGEQAYTEYQSALAELNSLKKER